MARILVGEDEPLVRGLLVLMLELEGHVVTAAADGQTAFDALCAEPYDLAVIDVRLPGMTGVQVLEGAAREGRPVRALILTGDEDDEQVLAASRRLGARLRAKPIARAELMAEVNALLGAAAP